MPRSRADSKSFGSGVPRGRTALSPRRTSPAERVPTASVEEPAPRSPPLSESPGHHRDGSSLAHLTDPLHQRPAVLEFSRGAEGQYFEAGLGDDLASCHHQEFRTLPGSKPEGAALLGGLRRPAVRARRCAHHLPKLLETVHAPALGKEEYAGPAMTRAASQAAAESVIQAGGPMRFVQVPGRLIQKGPDGKAGVQVDVPVGEKQRCIAFIHRSRVHPRLLLRLFSHQISSSSRYHWAVRRSPSSRSTRGSYPRRFRAFEMSKARSFEKNSTRRG
jgi:hypothetical protein